MIVYVDYNIKPVKAKQEHECNACSKPILKGDMYKPIKVDENSWIKVERYHLDCY